MMENKDRAAILAKTATIISAIFHPLLMPVYGMIIIFTAPTLFWYVPVRVKLTLLLVIASNNVLIPVSLLPFFVHRNIVSSWSVRSKKDRIAPLVTVSLFYIITTYIMLGLQIPVFIKGYIISVSLIIICITIINFWKSISIHSAGAGAVLGLVFMLSFIMSVPLLWFIVITLLVAGMILSSRLLHNTHNPGEVYSGFLIGFAGMSLFMIIF